MITHENQEILGKKSGKREYSRIYHIFFMAYVQIDVRTRMMFEKLTRFFLKRSL